MVVITYLFLTSSSITTIIILLILKINLVDVARQKNNVGILRGRVVRVMFYSSNH